MASFGVGSEGVSVTPVPPEATFALRQRVLRPHQRVTEMGLAGDEDTGTLHLGAVDDTGEVVGTLRLEPVPCPWFPRRPDAWQLRGMATAEHLRGRGIGADLLAAAVRHIADHGGGLLWCNARIPAETFYARAGFVSTDHRWNDPLIGAHVGMVREVDGT